MHQLSAITSTEFVFALLPIISAEVVQSFALLQVLSAVPLRVAITGDQVITDQIASPKSPHSSTLRQAFP